jgi:Flp pilus assembly protein TadG
MCGARKVFLNLKKTFQRLALLQDRRGVAAIEFALFGSMLCVGTVNVADIGIYIYQRMEVENSTQMGAQAAWNACTTSLTLLPATLNCSGLNSAVQNATQQTSLGKQVTLQAGSPSEGYYCLNVSNALQYVSNVNSKPADCSAVGMPGLQPADYITITVTFAYAPLFPGLTVARAFPAPIVRTSMMRLD